MSEPLPPALNFTGGLVTQGQFKAAMTQMIAYLQGLLGTDGTTTTARATLGIPTAFASPYNDRGNWSSGATYAVNDAAVDPTNGFLYVAFAVVGPSATEPHLDTSHWYLAQGLTAAQVAASSGAALIGFIQGWTNAVARTVQAKLRDTSSTADAGTVGDGSTDDRTALNNALASGSAGVPQDMYLPVPTDFYSVSDKLSWPLDYSLNFRGPGTAECQLRFQQANGHDCILIGQRADQYSTAYASGFGVLSNATAGDCINVQGGTGGQGPVFRDMMLRDATATGAAALRLNTSFIGLLENLWLWNSKYGLKLEGCNGIAAIALWLADNTVNLSIDASSRGNRIHAIELGLSALDVTKSAFSIAGMTNKLEADFYENFTKAQAALLTATACGNVLDILSRSSFAPYDLGWHNVWPVGQILPYANRNGTTEFTGPRFASGNNLQNQYLDSSFKSGSSNWIQYGATGATITVDTGFGLSDNFSLKLDWGTTGLSGAQSSPGTRQTAVSVGDWFSATQWIYLSRDMASNETLYSIVNGAGQQNRFIQPFTGLKGGRWYPLEIGWLIDTTESVTLRICLSLDSGTTHAALITHVDDISISVNFKEHTTVSNPSTSATQTVNFAGEYHFRTLTEQAYVLSGPSNQAHVGGVVANDNTPVSTGANTTLTAFASYAVGAFEAWDIGRGFRVTFWGTTAANGNNKTATIVFAGTNLFTSGAVAANAQDWWAQAVFTRIDASTFTCMATGDFGGRIAPKKTTVTLAQGTTATLAASILNGTASAGDVTGSGWLVEAI